MRPVFTLTLTAVLAICAGIFCIAKQTPGKRAETAREKWTLHYNELLQPIGAKVGDSVFIRILKEEKLLTFYIQPEGTNVYHTVKSFPILALSGTLGPKTKEGDKQGPEGFYATTQALLNPNSSYHLSFNIGYPNARDQAHGHTGSFIMVHGKAASIGCFAIGNEPIEQVYTLVEAALDNGQPQVPIHIYPFAMTAANLEAHSDSRHAAFWQELKPFWDYTELHKYPPQVRVKGKHYTF